MAGRGVTNCRHQPHLAVDWLAVHAEHDVIFPDSGLGGWGIWLDAGDDGALAPVIALRQAHAQEPFFPGSAIGEPAKLLDYGDQLVDRDGKPNVAGSRRGVAASYRRIDAHNFSAHIDERAARVARRNWGIVLDQSIERARIGDDGALQCRHNAGRNRGATVQVECVTNCDNGIAHAHRTNLRKQRWLQTRCINL